MIGYLGLGIRRYGLQPITIRSRASWEFEAVLRGRIAPVLHRAQPPLHARSLWVFPPGSAHGWRGDGSEPAEVAVFHTQSVPEPLRSLRMEGGYLRCRLHPSDVPRLRGWASRVDRCFARADARNPLHLQDVVTGLCLLALRELPAEALPDPASDPSERVARALAWFREHLHEGMGLADVAAAVHCSPAHLRRLFHRVLDRSPAQAFACERWERARDLLAQGRQDLQAIATACGFSDRAALSRAFKRQCGLAPRDWRRIHVDARQVRREAAS